MCIGGGEMCVGVSAVMYMYTYMCKMKIDEDKEILLHVLDTSLGHADLKVVGIFSKTTTNKHCKGNFKMHNTLFIPTTPTPIGGSPW